NAFAVLQPVDLAKASNVEQHATAHHLVLGVLDPEDVEALGVDQFGVVSIVTFVFVEDVAKRIPMRRALHAQHQRVVGITDLVPVLLSGDGVGARGKHLMDGIEAPPKQTSLRTLAIKWNPERENLAGADQARGLDDVLRRYVIERTDLVVLAPAAPIFQF